MVKSGAARQGVILMAAAACMAAATASPLRSGRWEGEAFIEGVPMPIVIDLAPAATRTWVGSVILPGRRIKGAPLADVRVDTRGAHFTLAAAFAMPTDPPPAVDLQWRDAGRAQGQLRLGGLVAPVTLQRTGPAQVDAAATSTGLDDMLLGRWVGRYELGGSEREVTLTLARDATGLGRAQMVIVGRRRTELAFDLVIQGPRFLTLRANDFDLTIEGPWHAEGIDATLEQGPYEASLPLRRANAELPR
jgi:hypothetical protein